MKESPLLKLGTKVVVKKRVSLNRRIKGFEPVAQVAIYLGPIPDTKDGHFVLTEDQRVMKTTRIVPYNEREEDEELEDLKKIGWRWVTDPDGKVFYVNERTNEKSWDCPLRVEVNEETDLPE